MKFKICFCIAVGIVLSANLKSQSNDTDAQAFLTATGITNSGQVYSINHLVLDLKNAGIWTKMKAIYPFVGGTANSHKYNLKDPRDLDIAYRLTFFGTWIHSATGALPDGSTAYAQTYFQPYAALSLNSTHISYYSKTETTGSFQEMGVDDGAEVNQTMLAIDYNGTGYYRNNSTGYGFVAQSSSVGFFINSRINSGYFTIYQNGSSILNASIPATGLSTNSITIGKNDITYTGYTNRECSFASIGDGLSSVEAAALTTAVNNYLSNLTNVDIVASSSQWATSADMLYNTNSGNIGIGTSNPHEKLSVNGNILAKKVKVSMQASDWSDYVFEKNYKRPTLTEIEKYIKVNKHLSEIPSAKNVETNGVDLGYNQALLLKKVEELTLILIDQNKKQQVLEKTIKQQNARINHLEKIKN